MPAKKLTPVSRMFAGAQQSQEVLHLKDRVAELEEEIINLRSNTDTSNNQLILEQRIEELTAQLAERGGVHHVPIEKIHPDPDQPRTIFPQVVVEARAKSLREDGQLTPVILFPLENGEYKLFEGALRRLAAPLAGMTHLKAVFRTENESFVEVFDRQLTTSIQSEKLHGLDLANALIRLVIYKNPELQGREAEIPSFLNAAIQRLKRAKALSDLDKLQTAQIEEQEEWISRADLRDEERKVLLVILGKQLNPASINTNIFPLLKLPEDLQASMRDGLDASKARELAKLTHKRLGVNLDELVGIRKELACNAIQQQWSLSHLKQKMQTVIRERSNVDLAASKFDRAIQQVQSLKITMEDGVEQSHLKLLERTLQEKLKEVRSLMRSLEAQSETI